jgi:hypothetical protein
MYSYDVQYPEFQWDQYKKMGPIDVGGAVDAFTTFPFSDLFQKTESLGADATAATIWFRAPSDQPALAIWLLQPGIYQIYMENFGDKVTIESKDREFIIDMIKDFFSGNHEKVYEKLARDSSAVGNLGLWNRLKKIFS